MADCPVVNPLAQASTIQNPNVINLNYTNQDFWSMKTRLINFLNERFGPNGSVLPNTFNDLVEGDIAIMLIENWAFLADTLSFKMDQIVNEIFIDTVTEVENIFRLAKLVGFQPTPPIAGVSYWSATINNKLLADVVIPTPVQINITSAGIPTTIELFPKDSQNNPIFTDNIIIPAGTFSNVNIIGVEGRTFVDSFTGTGAIAQSYQLTQAPVLFGSITVLVNGVTWTQVDYFTDSQPRQEYRVEFDSSYDAFIIFGNNRAGLSPPPNSQIQITYRVGGGTNGNIVTGAVSTQQQATVAGLAFSVPVTYTNYTSGTGGYAGDRLDDVRQKLPAWIRTQNRAVTGLDYKTLTDQFATPYHGQIGKSTVVLRNFGCAANVIDVYILALNGTSLITASDDLKVDLMNQLETQKMITDYICIRDGQVILVDVVIEAVLDKFYRKFEAQNNALISNLVDQFFALNLWDYGQTLKDTDLIKQLASVTQVQSFSISFSGTDQSGETITAQFYQIIRPDTVTISFLYE